MRPGPAVGTKVQGDAGGQERDAEGESSGDPGELDAALEHEVVKQAEDQDQDGRLGEERGAAPAGDQDKIEDG